MAYTVCVTGDNDHLRQATAQHDLVPGLAQNQGILRRGTEDYESCRPQPYCKECWKGMLYTKAIYFAHCGVRDLKETGLVVRWLKTKGLQRAGKSPEGQLKR